MWILRTDCPTRGLTVTPRQRIVNAREVQRLESDVALAQAATQFRAEHLDFCIDSCVACGMCAKPPALSVSTQAS